MKLACEGLGVAIAGKPICRGLDVSLQAGDCLGILGRNGAGKTTLLHSLAGLYPVDSGAVLIDDQPLQQMRRRAIAQRLGLLSQDDDSLFPGTVLETALLGRHPYLGRWQTESASDIAQAQRVLAQLQLDTMQDRLVSTLSGGERRRLALATLLLQNPPVMLLDEPTNHLDLHYQVSLLDILRQRLQTGEHLAVLVLHDLNLAMRYCNRLLLLYGDGSHECLDPASLSTAQASRLYGHEISTVDGPHGKVYIPA